MQDRFIKIMLVVIAGLLLANLYKSGDTVGVVSMPSLMESARAQSATANTLPAATSDVGTLPARGPSMNRDYKLLTLNGFPVEDMKDIVALGDGRSFIASNPKGFMVYQVVPAR